MSLVGTRPPTMDEWEKYELHHRKRLAIKPGLTGMWQVSGRSDITDFEEVVELDTRYIAEWCLKLDIEIWLRQLWSFSAEAARNDQYILRLNIMPRTAEVQSGDKNKLDKL